MSALTLPTDLYERIKAAISGSSQFTSEVDFLRHAIDLAEADAKSEDDALQELGQLLDARRSEPANVPMPTGEEMLQRYRERHGK
ncbi:MAG: hypothetical protein AAFX86_14320 [Pseudomonadota bacterium]